MAIGPKGEVTTTGLMNSTGKIPDAPDMSNLKPPAQPQEQKAPAAAPAAMAQRPEPKDPAVMEKLNALSEEEKIQLDMVLSPSLANIMKKISPDASQLIDQFTSQEENVILPVSVVKNFAVRKYQVLASRNPYKDSLQNCLSHNQIIQMCHLKICRHLTQIV